MGGTVKDGKRHAPLPWLCSEISHVLASTRWRLRHERITYRARSVGGGGTGYDHAVRVPVITGPGEARVQVSRGSEADLQDDLQDFAGLDTDGPGHRDRVEGNGGQLQCRREEAGRQHRARGREGGITQRGALTAGWHDDLLRLQRSPRQD